MNREIQDGNTPTHWWQVDLDVIQIIAGVVTQGRGNTSTQYVSSFKVKISNNEVDWINVDNDKIYTVTHATQNTYFNESVKARYLRIYPQSYFGAPVMRSAVIINKYEGELQSIFKGDKNSYKKIIVNSDKFTTQLDIKENNNFTFNMYLDLYAKIESDTLMCHPPKIVDEIKY